MKLWVVGQVKSDDAAVWELGGVFSTRDKAVAVCTESSDCVWSVTVDEFLGRETSIPDDCFYPVAGET